MLNAHFLDLINVILNHLSKELLLWGKYFNKPIGEQVEGKKQIKTVYRKKKSATDTTQDQNQLLKINIFILAQAFV